MDFEKFFEEETKEEEINLDIRRYLYSILKRKWLVIGLFLVILIPWLFYVKSKPPEYEATTWIRFKNYNLEKLQVLNQSRYIELTSRTFAENIVAKLGLTLQLLDKESNLLRQDVFDKFVTNLEPTPGVYSLALQQPNFVLNQIVGENQLVEVASGPISQLTEDLFKINGLKIKISPSFARQNISINFKVSRFRDAVAWFQAHVDVKLRQGGSLMQVGMTHYNPIIVTEMVNSLAEIYVEESISFERIRTKGYKNAINQRLKAAKEQLDQHNEELKKFKEGHFISLDTDVQKNVKALSDLEKEKRNLESYTENLSDLLNKLDDIGKTTITPGSEDKDIRYIYGQINKNLLFKDNTSMGLLIQQLGDYESRRAPIVRQYPASNPKAVELDVKIKEFQISINNIAKTQLSESIQEIQDVYGQIRVLEREIQTLPAEQMQLSELSKNVDVSGSLYTELQKKAQEIELSEAVDTTEGIDIMDPAIVPEQPVNRDKKQKAAAGTVFALLVSLGVAIFIEFFDKSLKSPDDIKKYLKLNVIGTIPKIEFNGESDLRDADKLKKIDSQLVTYDYSPTPVGEAYRALRTKIVFSKDMGKINSLVISSFAPGDGKSFTSSNLAVTLAQHKTNTLLIDADLRRGVLHNTFGVNKEPGLSNYLMGMVRFEDAVSETHVPNLSMISCGSMMPNPSELLGSIQLKRLIEEAKKRFDLVLFDSPPLNAATDSVVIGTQTQGVILIVRAEVTNRNIARQKLDLFHNVPANLIGVILNGAQADLAHEGYSYYHY